MSEPHARPEDTPTIACNLGEEALEARRRELRERLLPRIEVVRELADGYALGLPPGAESQREAAAFVEFERGCCGFARYEVRSEGERVWIEIRGPEGTRAFLRRWLPGRLLAPPGASDSAARQASRFGRYGVGAGALALGTGLFAWAFWRRRRSAARA